MAGAELNNDMLSVKEETITVMTPKGGTLQTYASEKLPMYSSEKEFIISYGPLMTRDHPIIM